MSVMATITDDDLERRVVGYLWQKHHPSLRLIDVSAANGTVILRGKLNSFYEKQLCLHTCQRVAGVIRVVDELEVTRQASTAVPDNSAAVS